MLAGAVPAQPLNQDRQGGPSTGTASQGQAAQPSPPAPSQGQAAYTADYERICHEPKDDGEADLCQQWRSATAADRVVDLTKQQIFWTKVEFGALLLTVVLSAWATIAASRGVRAANEANQITRAEQRPWLTYELGNSISLERRGGSFRAKLSRTIKNRGKSPAFAVSYLTLFKTYDAPLLLKDEFDKLCSAYPPAGETGDFPIIFPDDPAYLDTPETALVFPFENARAKRAILAIVVYRLGADLNGPFGLEGRAYRMVRLGEGATERIEFALDEYTSWRVAR